MKRGVSAIGVVVKPHRIYISNRTVGKAIQRIHYFNTLTPNKKNAIKFQSSINSYLGLMKQYTTYKIRKKITDLIDKKWNKFVFINEDKTKMIIRKKVEHVNYSGGNMIQYNKNGQLIAKWLKNEEGVLL